MRALGELLDPLDERGGGDVRDERDGDDAAPAGLDDVPPDDPIDRPVSALDQDVRLNEGDQGERIRFVEENHVVHAGERRQNLSPLGFRDDRPALGFDRPDRGIAVQADDQTVAQGPRGLQIARVADVQEVKAAVREDEAFPPRAPGAEGAAQGLGGLYLGGHELEHPDA